MRNGREPLEIVLDGVKLHAMRLASPRARGGPVLVLLHDSLGSVGLWRDFPERLAEATRLGVFAYDRRGHGASDPLGPRARTTAYLHDEAATLARVLDEVGIEEAILFGHSDGGSIALLAAAHHPRAIRGVVAEAAHVFVDERTLDGVRAAQRALGDGDLLARLAKHHGEKAEALVAVWIATWLAPWFRGWNVEEDLRRIRVPVLVLQGELDEYGTEAQVHAIARGVSGPARTLVLPGIRHTPHREAPDAVLGAVLDFLAA